MYGATEKCLLVCHQTKWASTLENLSSGVREHTGADQPALPRSLISAFVILFCESIIYKPATGEISTFKLVSIAVETGLKHALLKTPEDRFSRN